MIMGMITNIIVIKTMGLMPHCSLTAGKSDLTNNNRIKTIRICCKADEGDMYSSSS